MTITKIKKIANTNRYHLYIDDQWYGIFLDESLARYHLKTNQEIDEDEMKKIKIENDQKVAFDMAAAYMEKYVVSEKGIRDYLKKKNFENNAIENAINKLKDYGYINDERFAKNYFDSLSSNKGKRTIANKLRAKGIAKEIVDELIENVSDEDQLEIAKKQAVKFAKNREKSLKTEQKCIAHLIYKGYDYGVAQEAAKYALNFYEGENDDWI